MSKMIEWLNNKFGTDLAAGDIDEMKSFTLLWNMFENLLFGTRFNPKQIEEKMAEIDIDENVLNEVLDYFKNRYIKGDQVTERFSHLYLRENDRPELVQSVLREEINDLMNKLVVAIIITSRYRNNLFHGIKDFKLIKKQESNFQTANRLLQSILNQA